MRTIVPLEPIGSLVASRYRVQEHLGHGGMAAVYRVLDERAGEQLALKRGWARDAAKLPRNAALLEREYHTLAHLAHPRIIEVRDYGVDERGPYYTMELLDGTDLERAGRLPWQRACAVMCDVASSLAILHSRGLVHRDVSLRNVRYTARGHAKLIDFGAMTSIGVPGDVVGTPPFMAPEVLQMQALDARADLFSLGALGYHLLTGRHAYPARRISDLRDVWRSRPLPPTKLAPELPAELSAIMLRLLALERSARPQSAGEVIEQLKTLAGLTLEDVAATSRAYLTTPTLVGREAALLQVRKSMLALMRGDGGALVVHGAPGSGRSRLLDACALEAKLLGAAVVRADARDAALGDWGVARAIGTQLLELFPNRAAEAARLTREVLGQVLEELRGDPTESVTAFAVERSLLIRELREFILAIGGAQRLLVVVDDAERIDEPSAALLGSIAHKAERRPLLLALAMSDDGKRAQSGPLHLVCSLARTIETPHLSGEQTEALMRSVFGDVPNLAACATRIQGLSHGNPRAAMELAQHLVDRGRARYEAGSWALPAALDEADLPSDLAARLAARLGELSADARELVDALTLADGDALPLADYPAVTEHGQSGRVFRALDELVAARILVAGAQRFDFTQRGFLAVAAESMPASRRQAIHRRIAACLEAGGGDALGCAHHLLQGGRERDAIDLLCSLDLVEQAPPVSLLTAAIDHAERMGLPARTLHRLRVGVVMNAPASLESDALKAVLPRVIAQLERDSGLAAYRELGHLPEDERLTQAIAQAQQSFQALPDDQRVQGVLDATRELARIATALPSMGVPVYDLALIEMAPDLTPLLPLSPALQVVDRVIESSKEWLRCRLLRAQDINRQVLERIAQPDRGGLDDAQHQRLRLALIYTVGLFEASFAMPSAEQRARELDQHRALRVNAWRVRSLYQLGLGNPAEARKCARQAELLQAQDGLKEVFLRTSAGIELLLHSRMGDLLAVKRTIDDLAALASSHPGWRPVELLGRCRYAELQGDLASALAFARAGLELAPPLRHPFWGPLAGQEVQLLCELGQKDQAAQLARERVALCRAQEILSSDLFLSAALVLGKTADFGAALDAISFAIDRFEARGRAGFGMAMLYEGRARIAIWMQDRTALDHWTARCFAAYAESRNPAFAAALGQLFDEARQHGITPSDDVVALQETLRPPPADSEYETVQSRMAECIDGVDRGRCALTLLLQCTVSSTGYLYVARDSGLSLLASLPEGMTDSTLDTWAERYARVALESDRAGHTTADESDSASDTDRRGDGEPRSRGCDRDGRLWQAKLLFDGTLLVGVLVMPASGTHPIFPRSLCGQIARQLLEQGDATGWSM